MWVNGDGSTIKAMRRGGVALRSRLGPSATAYEARAVAAASASAGVVPVSARASTVRGKPARRVNQEVCGAMAGAGAGAKGRGGQARKSEREKGEARRGAEMGHTEERDGEARGAADTMKEGAMRPARCDAERGGARGRGRTGSRREDGD